MSYFLRIFGRSTAPTTRREIAEFIAGGSFFDGQLAFQPSPDSTDSNAHDWRSLTVRYDAEKRPVRFERNVNDALFEAEVRELLSILDRSKKTNAQQEILHTIQRAAQVIGIEVDRDAASDSCWEMLDAVEVFPGESL